MIDDLYQNGCSGKVGFDLRAHALAAAKRRRGRGIYLCQACGKWHVGSEKLSKKSFRRKRGAKLANKQFYMVR